ncbi:MAG: DUF4142 domain-containing protein [Rudaea sp.]|nr:DUF4142 domain-containing protein [Rudaea sp.]
MRKYTLLQIFLFSGTCTLAAFIEADAQGTSSPQTPAESPDAAFVQQAGQGGMAEVELSKLAADSAKSPQVREFAQQMIRDHTANNKQLALIATHENIQLPKVLDGGHANLRDKLQAEHGGDFDHDYVDVMRADHEKMAALLRSSAATVSTEELRSFIKTTLPVVEAHLRMAQDLKVN